MTIVVTHPRRELDRCPRITDAAPGIAYHRWHRYDDRKWNSTKDSRLTFLHEVAARINAVAKDTGYARWHAGHHRVLDDLGARCAEFPTLWRLVAGTATNPALESGFHLHPLWGVPFLPGSSVKGLLHHYAEDWAVRSAERIGGELRAEAFPGADSRAIEALLAAAWEVRQVFGGLTVDRGEWEKEPVGSETPRSLLEGWKKDFSKAETEDAKRLLAQPTSGRLTVYDSLPVPGCELVEADVLTPHYKEYYDSEGKVPPSDDQDPNPVFFLAVRAGVRFRFRWRLAPREAVEAPRVALSPPVMERRVKDWLLHALATWGAGGKTAAGYGYFDTGPDSVPAEE